MVMRLHGIISLITFLSTIDFMSSECPFFQLVGVRDKTCFEKNSCQRDQDCQAREKCCENPCGISKCYNLNPTVLQTKEKCPLERLYTSKTCSREATKFCYTRNCKRCCQHDTSCNPAPSILSSADICNKEICKDYKCYQGAECQIENLSHKPFCKCTDSCNNTRKYICANDLQNVKSHKTYFNKCYMDREACQQNSTIVINHDGKCKVEPKKETTPVKKPYIKKLFHTLKLHEQLRIRCYGDRKGVQLKWYQKRENGVDILMDRNFVDYLGSFNINGKLKEVVGLIIPSIGHGNYGTYSCKQTYNGSMMETLVHIQHHDQVLFDSTLCLLQKNAGNCKGQFTNYYFDELANLCYNFTYNGCDGNANNFQTKEECQVKCLRYKPNNQMKYIHHGVKCGSEVCEYYSECTQRKNSSTCLCPNTCPFKPKPVCASDGKTYNTPCAMKSYACKWRKPLIVLYTGECKPFRDKNGVELINTTKKIFNLCELRQCNPYAKCYVNPFTRIPHCYCPEQCPFKPDIICGSNMEHFLNECYLQKRSCKIGRKLYVLKKGLCLFKESYT